VIKDSMEIYEKLILLEVTLEQNVTENFISWNNVGTKFRELDIKLKEAVMLAEVIGKFGQKITKEKYLIGRQKNEELFPLSFFHRDVSTKSLTLYSL
jgi:hypothetical protein